MRQRVWGSCHISYCFVFSLIGCLDHVFKKKKKEVYCLDSIGFKVWMTWHQYSVRVTWWCRVADGIIQLEPKHKGSHAERGSKIAS